jgi:hypothetical protein
LDGFADPITKAHHEDEGSYFLKKLWLIPDNHPEGIPTLA